MTSQATRLYPPLGALALFLAVQGVLFFSVGTAPVENLAGWVARGAGLPYNTLIVLLGTSLFGMAAGIVGSFAVLRGRSLLGDAIAHGSLPGLCIAFLLFRERNFAVMLLGALTSGLAGAGLVAWLGTSTRIKADAAIGITLSVFFGLGIALSGIIQRDPSGRQAGLDSYLLGKTAGMVSQDLVLISLVALNVLCITFLFLKEFTVVSFDPYFAAVQGWPLLFLDVLMMGLLVAATVIGLPAVGVVLMAAMLIIPGVSARFWTERMGPLLLLSGVIGLLTGMAGTWASAKFSALPAGPVIVLTGTTFFLLSLLFAPRRGVLARVREDWLLKRKTGRQNLLRSLYEFTEKAGEGSTIAFDSLLAARSWSRRELFRLLSAAQRLGWVLTQSPGAWVLTQEGRLAAAEVVRSHRLWELFLVKEAALNEAQVDRDADEIEHVLSPEILEQLEHLLQEEGRWPHPAVPRSVHPI